MSFSSGVYTLPGPALVTGEVVSATENNQFRNDVAGAFNLTMLRNGTSTATANLPMGGYKLTGLGAPSTNGDSLAYGAAAVVTTLTSTSLTATRVPYAGTGGLLQDASTFTFDGTTLTAAGFSGPLTGNVTGNVSGNAGTVTNGVYTTGDQTIGGTKTFSSNPIYSAGTANGVVYLNGSKVATTGSALTFDGTNLGLGVTPSAWLSSAKVAQIGPCASLWSLSTSLSRFSTNAYIDSGGTARYINTAAAADYRHSNGAHEWLTAAPGTAGNAISFTQAMTLDASGNLLVGYTSVTNGKLAVNGAVRVNIDNYKVTSNEKFTVEGASGFSNSANVLYVNSAISGSNTFATFYVLGGPVGSISTTGSTTAYNTSSDYRLKENIQPMQNALAVVAQLNPVTYTWKADGSDGQGFIAHELQAVVPDCVTGEKDATRIEEYEITPAVPAVYEEVVIPAVLDEEGNVVEAEKTEQKLVTAEIPAVMGKREVPVYQGIDTSFLVATLTKAIQELAAKVDAQQAEIDALKNTAA